VDTTRCLIAAVAATALAVSLAACSSSNSSQLPKASPATLSTRDSSRLHLALTSKKSATVAAALAPEVKAAYLKNPRQLLRAGSKLDILSDKMQVSGDTATVPAKVTGGANAGSYLLVLEKQDGKWFLIGTEKQ
jgi:glucose/arabinose dehydrogenase